MNDGTGADSALAAIESCLNIGVKEFVLCPGARNSELLALISSLEDVRTYHHPEERSAAYFALGRALSSQRPVAVVTTSGTAASELLPAAIEAHYQSIPLVLLTADRPVRFRGKGAPQAIDQHDIFGVYAAGEIDSWSAQGPLHINVPLEEPSFDRLENIVSPVRGNEHVAGRILTNNEETVALQEFLNRSSKCLVIVGCLPLDWREDVKKFLKRLNVPVIAEATSGIREAFPPCHVANNIGSVLRIGGVPSSSLWRDLEEKERVEVFSVAPNGLPGLARTSSVVTFPCWNSLEVPQGISGCMPCANFPENIFSEYPLSEQSWVRRLSEYIPEKSLVFLGNSQPVREWNLAAAHGQRGLRCFSNCGANGIDGCLSTFLGLSVDEKESWAIIGDLTALYDLAGPWIVNQLSHSNRRIVVINNGGGRIFRRLPALENFSPAQMRLIQNTHSFKFKGWADMWGMSYRKVAALEDLRALPDGLLLIELFPSLEQSDDFWHSIKS